MMDDDYDSQELHEAPQDVLRFPSQIKLIHYLDISIKDIDYTFKLTNINYKTSKKKYCL